MAAATIASVAALPVAAQSSEKSTTAESHRPRQKIRIVSVPGYPTAYIIPVEPKDTRTPRQRCVDKEVTREGGSPSALAMGAIDLKCSQR